LFGLEGNVAFQTSENKGLTAIYRKTWNLALVAELKVKGLRAALPFAALFELLFKE